MALLAARLGRAQRPGACWIDVNPEPGARETVVVVLVVVVVVVVVVASAGLGVWVPLLHRFLVHGPPLLREPPILQVDGGLACKL